MKRRGLLIGLAIIGAATASIAVVAVAAFIQRLPEPEQADQQGLFRWLVQTHLRDEPADIQQRLLNRVEQELAHGIDLTKCLTQIDKEQRARLLENVDLLAECWFFREADRYFSEPETGRIALVKRQAERVRQLGILDQISALEGHPKGTASAGMAAMADNARRLERWLADVAPQQRQRVSEYFSTLRAALVWNSLQQWFSPLDLLKPTQASPKGAAQKATAESAEKQTAA
ncbi:MAG TPA: hypothetical protein VHX65_04685 [Pirellulales bacterium]|nr:hypothetical protein [Pirellulales bacterium]